MLKYPAIDPIIFSLGPIVVRWYSLAYISGILLGWQYAKYLIKQCKILVTNKQLEDFITYAVLGIIIGGRLGYVIFYDPVYYLEFPLEILKTYQGGMSFHGGLTGIIITSFIFCLKNKIKFFHLTDLLAVISPIGIFFGRLANFINGELYGKLTNMPWGMIFPDGGYMPRHPSQVYEAILEGIGLFFLMKYLAINKQCLNKPGFCSGIFLIYYTNIRVFIEIFREVDPQLGYFFNYFTMGQLLCLPMMLTGIYLLYQCPSKPSTK